MSYTLLVTPGDLATYLTLETVDEDRAQMLIDDAVTEALSVVTVGTIDPILGPTDANLPPGSAAVIRAAVARIYLNPRGVGSEAVGPFNYNRSITTGAMLSKAERTKLRRLAGIGGGAFTIDPTNVGAMTDFRDSLAQPTDQESIEYLEETGFV